MKILAIESSCDETAAAVVEDGRNIISSVVASQVEEHKLYGGVVPEIASRRHAEAIVPVVRQALEDADCKLSDIDAIGVTYAPRTYRSVACGSEFCKRTFTCNRNSACACSPSSFTHCVKLYFKQRIKTAVSLSCCVGRSQPYCYG